MRKGEESRRIPPLEIIQQVFKTAEASLCKTGDEAVLDVHVHGGRSLWKAWHAHDGAGGGYDESGAGVEDESLNRKREAGRSAELLRICGEGERSLCNADRELVEAEFNESLEVLLGGVGQGDVGCAVDLLCNGFDLGDDVEVFSVGVDEFASVFSCLDDLLGEFLGAFAAECESVADCEAESEFENACADDFDFFVGVGVEVIEAHYDVQAEVGEVLQVGFKIYDALFESFDVRLADFREGNAAVPLQSLGGGDENDGSRLESGGAALDVEELFRAEVGAEACFSDGVVAEGEGGLGCNDGVAAVGDVCERSAVDECEVAFNGLDEVRLHCVLEKNEQGAGCAEFLDGVGAAVALDAEDDSVEASAEVLHVGGKAEDGHEFAGGGDVEAGFSRNAVGGAAEAGNDVAEHAVVAVHDAAPEDFLQIDLPLMAGVVEKSCEKVVGCGDGVQVAGEVKVDRFHRKNLAVAAAGGAALHAEDRAEAWFAQSENGVLADLLHALCKSDGGGGLAGAGRHAGSCGHEDELALHLAGGVELYLGLVAAVRFEFSIRKTGAAGEVVDVDELSGLSNFDVAEHFVSPIVK